VAPIGSGIEFAPPSTCDLPLHLYKTRLLRRFDDAHIRNTLYEGLYGWQVTDCVVTMNACDCADGSRAGDTTPARRCDFANSPGGADAALQRAGTWRRTDDPVNMKIASDDRRGVGVSQGSAAGRRTSIRGDLPMIRTTVPAEGAGLSGSCPAVGR
jgi:hypothetical protein